MERHGTAWRRLRPRRALARRPRAGRETDEPRRVDGERQATCRVVHGLSGLILAGILVHFYLLAFMLVQLYLAGTGDFGAESRQWHENSVYVLGVPILLLMIVALVTRLGWREVGGAALLGALFVGQVALHRVQHDASYVPALYTMNGLAMMGLAAAIDRSPGRTRNHARRVRRVPWSRNQTNAVRIDKGVNHE